MNVANAGGGAGDVRRFLHASTDSNFCDVSNTRCISEIIPLQVFCPARRRNSQLYRRFLGVKSPLNPYVTVLRVRTLDGRPSDSMGSRFPISLADMRGKGMIERLSVNRLCARRKVILHRLRKLKIRLVGHCIPRCLIARTLVGNTAANF